MTTIPATIGLRKLGADLRRLLPAGHLIPDPAWRTRHTAVVALLWIHVPVIIAFGLATGHEVTHMLKEGLLVALPAILAGISALDRRTRSLIATGGLLIDSAILVHLAHGAIEMHFHYFIMLSVIALYQDWAPFLFSIAFVALQHSILGYLDPESVFSHDKGRATPMLWALIHGSFVLLASVANLAAWKLSERYTLYDSLTDLANRTLFRDRLEESLAAVAIHRRTMAVLYVDLDRFKAVNDTLGHAAGDDVLIEVGQRLKACTSTGDLVARLGGDEFGILLTNLRDPSEAADVAERAIQSVSAPFVLKCGVAEVGASVGIAIGQGEPLQAEILVREADEAMYISKNGGRGRYTMHEAAAPGTRSSPAA